MVEVFWGPANYNYLQYYGRMTEETEDCAFVDITRLGEEVGMDFLQEANGHCK